MGKPAKAPLSRAVERVLRQLERLRPDEARVVGDVLVGHSGIDLYENPAPGLEFFVAYLQEALVQHPTSRVHITMARMEYLEELRTTELHGHYQRAERLNRRDAWLIAHLQATRQRKRGPDEEVAVETATIVRLKDELGNSWRQIQNVMHSKYGVRISVDALRQRYHRAKRSARPSPADRGRRPPPPPVA